MRYNDCSAILSRLLEPRLNYLLRVDVKGRRSLVEKEQLWVLDQASSNSDALSLTTVMTPSLFTATTPSRMLCSSASR